jgi:predicted transcriptional regulator
MDQTEQQLDFASITADVVSSYVSNNSVHRADLPNVIASVHAALQELIPVGVKADSLGVFSWAHV